MLEVEQLLPHCATPEIRVAVLLSAEAGLRKAEVMALRWEDIDWDKHVVRVHDHKQGFYRWAGLSERLLEELSKLHEALRPQSDERVVGLMSSTGLYYRFAEICRRAGVGEQRFHALRAAFARRARLAGLTSAQVSMMLGYRPPRRGGKS